MHRRVAMLLVIVVLTALLPGCIPARAGARCRSTDWERDGKYVLRCTNGRWKRSMTYQQAATIIAALLRRPAMGDVVRPASLGTPQLPNTADPSVLVDAGVTYVYATTTYLHVPVVALTDLDAVRTQSDMYTLAKEAMPSTPTWAATAEVWAPTVAKLSDGYVMFFAAHRQSPPDPSNDQCVGRARSSSPLGPFVPEATPVTCGNDGIHDALDPSVFVGPDGAAHLLVAMSGSTTNIWTFPLDGNGNISGPSAALETRDQPWEQVFLENPSMYYDGSTYLLTYSNNNWMTADYSTGIARCATPTGPCTDRTDGPWLSTVGDRSGPGGLTFFTGADGAPRVAFESYATGDIGLVGKRSTTIARFYTDPWPRLG